MPPQKKAEVCKHTTFRSAAEPHRFFQHFIFVLFAQADAALRLLLGEAFEAHCLTVLVRATP